MARKDYIEKITQNLEHLTKDELKDVAALTNAQFGVRLKVAEKEYWEKEIADLKSQLQQQALPVVPDCVAEFITKVKKADNNLTFAFNSKFDECPAKYWNEAIVWRLNHPEEFARAWLDGYTAEKPQLFYLRDELTGQFLAKDNQFKDRDRYFFWTGEDPLTHSIGTAWKLSFTQEEIDSMQTGSYEQIEVTE